MSLTQHSQTKPRITWANASTRSVDVSGTKFAYRELGADSGVPVIFLNHLAAELDRWDPRVVDGIASSAARDFLRRLKDRTEDRDTPVSLPTFMTQLKAIRAWAHQTPDDLSRIRHPVLVANGDQDKMVPSSNSVDLARRLSNAELVLYDDAGHISVSRSIREESARVLGVLRKRRSSRSLGEVVA